MQMTIALWIAMGAGVMAVAMGLLMLIRPNGSMDLGSVSQQWISQHRASAVHDPQR
jgi:hypothetical protein